MALDTDSLGPAPDIENIDTSTMDFGDDPGEDAAPEVKDDPEPEAKEEPEAKDEEPEEEAEVKEEKPRDDKGRFTEAKIPKSRFDEAVGKEREAREAAERRAEELERRLQEQAVSRETAQATEKLEGEIEALEAKHAELLLDGNTAEAAKVMKSIRHMERQIATAEAETRAAVSTSKALEADRLTTTIARLEADFPQFNTKSELFDKDLVTLTLANQRELIAEGMTPSMALDKAGRDVAERYIKKVEEAAPEDSKDGLSAATKTGDRNKQALDKALDTNKRQPPSMRDVGMNSDAKGSKGLPDVSGLTADEYEALPESTKARLRGDII